MAKIQVSTVKMTADVEVINVSAYLVAKVVRAHMRIDNILEGKHKRQKYNEETKKWEDVLDDNGNPMWDYPTVNAQELEDYVYPLLNELVEAFGVKDNRV